MLTILFALASTAPASVSEVDLPPKGPNAFYVSNRAPLAPQPFIKLPIGSIRPEGWIRTQLKLEASGFVGHLEEISPWLDKKNNAWLAADGQGDHGWEEVPYWLKGYGDLGYVLHDPKITAEAKTWIDGVLSSSRPDGWFGPEANRTANIDATGKGPDMWPNMAMLFALQSYYDVSQDPKVIKLMDAYFHYQMALPDEKFYQAYWEHMRGGDNLFSVYWLYNRTGEKWLLDLATKIHRRTADWTDGVANLHGVNFAQGFREPAEYALQTGDPKQAGAPERDYDLMRGEFGQVPGGMYGADENARKGYGDPRQAAETCAMVEMMFSTEELLAISGDPKWAERCEDVAFNSLPASMTADEKALHYLTAPNLIRIDGKNHAPDFQNGGKMLLFDPNDYRCCQHNVAQGWPYYAEHLWMATAHNGLAPVLYGPCSVTAKVGDGTPVTIREVTEYPFRDHVKFFLRSPKPVRFPLTLRIPSWSNYPDIKVNGKPVPQSRRNNRYLILTRTWREGDEVSLDLSAGVHFGSGAQSVDWGPLSFSLAIGEKVVKNGGTPAWPAYEVLPTTPWNFGISMGIEHTQSIVVGGGAQSGGSPDAIGLQWNRRDTHDESTPDSADALRPILRPMAYDEQPFLEGHAPIELKLPFRKVDQWQEDGLGVVGLLQSGMAYSSEPIQVLPLVPMGSTRLRISMFPIATDSNNAPRWKGQPKPVAPIPASASHVFEGDTLNALSDGLHPQSSDDQSVPRFTWWDRKGSTEWVEYDLPSPREVSGVDVYWFDDQPTGGGCRVPASCRVLVLQGGSWVPVATVGSPGVAKDKFNSIRFTRVFTQRIRLEVQLQPGFSGGILQWKLKP